MFKNGRILSSLGLCRMHSCGIGQYKTQKGFTQWWTTQNTNAPPPKATFLCRFRGGTLLDSELFNSLRLINNSSHLISRIHWKLHIFLRLQKLVSKFWPKIKTIPPLGRKNVSKSPKLKSRKTALFRHDRYKTLYKCNYQHLSATQKRYNKSETSKQVTTCNNSMNCTWVKYN